MADLMPVLSGDRPAGPAPNAEWLRREGDFYVKGIKLMAFDGSTYDITLMRQHLFIVEDIFVNFISGEIGLQDSMDLPHLMPLIGEEKIRITFTRPDIPDKSGNPTLVDEDIDMEFRVYKMGERTRAKDRHQFYTLYFVSEDMIKNQKVRVLKSYVNMPYSDMVTSIYDERLAGVKPLVVEPTQYANTLCVPNINPFQAINMIGARSESAEGNGHLYVFFENQTSYNFTTIGKLLTLPPVGSYTHSIKNILEEAKKDGMRNRRIEMDMQSMEDFDFSSNFDVLHNLSTGMYGSRVLAYDFIRRKRHIVEFDYNAQFDSFKHADKNKPFTDALDALGAPRAHQKFVPTNKDHDIVPWIANKLKAAGIIPLPFHVEDYILSRQSQIQQINNAKIVATVSGDPRKHIGQMIEFALPHNQGDWRKETEKEPFDNYLQGKYLLTRVTHRLDRDRYMMDMEMVKDSFFTKIAHVSPIEKAKPIY